MRGIGLWIIAQGALFWFITAWVMQDHALEWRAMKGWIVLALLAGFGGLVIGSYMHLGVLITHLIRIVLTYCVLILFLWREYSYSNPRKIVIILGIFLVLELLIAIPASSGRWSII
jgi:hypothetical protein